MIQYRYLCSQRPPMPGAIPTAGLVSIEEPQDGIDTAVVDGRTVNCWGYVVYNRPLSDQEAKNYELTYVNCFIVRVAGS